jgi:hypothetical protein
LKRIGAMSFEKVGDDAAAARVGVVLADQRIRAHAAGSRIVVPRPKTLGAGRMFNLLETAMTNGRILRLSIRDQEAVLP